MPPIKDTENFSRKEYRWIGVGMEFCLGVLFFCFIGYLIDIWTKNEEPEFMITGFFIGFVFMIYWLLKLTRDLRK